MTGDSLIWLVFVISDLLLWKESDDIVKEIKKIHKCWRLRNPILQGDDDIIELYYRVFIRRKKDG